MKVLLACEESQAACKAFRSLGHEAYSCDIEPCSGGHPEYHIQDDVLKHLKGWDLIIAFPPCTHLAVSGAKHFAKKREDGRQEEAINFFMAFMQADCPKVAVENPVGIISGKYPLNHFPEISQRYDLPLKPTQIIQPWQFGDEAQKTTCLWLRGLPNLTPTNIVGKGEFYTSPTGKRLPKWYSDNKKSKARSKTFEGIARAMADQWGGKCTN